MVLDELWTELPGASVAALACCFVAAAVALRWSSRQPARDAGARARRKQRAALETMDKSAQRFRLQVTARVPWCVWGGTGWGIPSSIFSRTGARRGRWRAAQVLRSEPLFALTHSILFLR